MKKLIETVLIIATSASVTFSAFSAKRLHDIENEDELMRSVSDDVVQVITNNQKISDANLYLLWAETYGLLKYSPERVQKTLKKFGADVLPEYEQVYSEVTDIVNNFKS